MAQKFLTDIEVTRGLVDSSGDLGVAGQVLSSTGSGTNWITNESNSTVVYLDEFTGDNSTVDFTLSVSVTDENITQVYIDGVYQNKDTYSVSNTTLTFSTAPPLNADIEVITFSTATTADDLQAGVVIIPVKNTHTASIAKGEPVYITGNVGSSARLQIAPADASNSAKMPAAGLLLQTLAVNAEGYVVTGGYLRNITTDTIDGTSTSSNDTVYVKSGGGLTMTKPTGSNLIQNIAKVARVASGSAGSLLVSSILRTNDIPNITNDYFWLGNSSGVATPTEFTSSVRGLISTSGNALSYDSSTGVITANYEESPTFTGNVVINGSLTGTTATFSASIIASGNSNSFGNTTVGALTASSISSSGSLSITGNTNSIGATTFTSNITVDGDVTIGNNASIKSIGSIRIDIDEDNNSTGRAFLVRNDGGTNTLFKIQEDGNVGIGKTSPSQKLDVEGSIRLNSELQIFTGTTDIGQISNSGGALNIQGTSTRDVSLGSDSYPQTVFIEGSNGKVGIGNTSPQSPLMVKGAGANGTVRIVPSSANAEASIGFYQDTTGTTTSTRWVAGVGGWGNTNDFTIGYSGGPNFLIDTSGRVGIGTTSPGNLLDVAGDTDITGQLVVSHDANYVAKFVNTATSMSNNNYALMVDSSSHTSNMSVAGAMAVDVNSGRAFTINGIGRVSIGGNSQTANTLTLTGSATELDIENTSGKRYRFNSDTSGNLRFEDKTGGTEVMRFASSNNVGIGTSSPNAKLHVDGSVHFGPDSGVVNPSNSQLLIEAASGNTTSLLMYTYGSSIFQIQSQGTQGTIGWSSSQPRSVIFTNSGAGSISVGINEGVPAAKLQVSGDRDGNSEYVAIFGEDGGANGAANSGNTTPVHKTLLTGYSIPYSGQTNARLTSVGFLEFDSTPGWTGNQRNWALTSGYDMGGTNGPKFAILMGDAQNVEPQLGTNGDVGTGTGDGANTRVAAYWKNSGDMVLPEGGLFVKGRITGDTDNANNDVSYLRTITIPYTGNTGSFTFDIDPVAEFGTRVSGGRLHLAVSGWQSRMNAGYIVYRNDGSGAGKIGTGNVTYFRYIWSETSGSQAEVAVSLISSSTNVIRISFSGWHSNDHGFEARLTATS